MGNKKKGKKNLLAINLIIVGILGIFVPLLPGLILIVLGIFLMFPNIYKIIKKEFFS